MLGDLRTCCSDIHDSFVFLRCLHTPLDTFTWSCIVFIFFLMFLEVSVIVGIIFGVYLSQKRRVPLSRLTRDHNFTSSFSSLSPSVFPSLVQQSDLLVPLWPLRLTPRPLHLPQCLIPADAYAMCTLMPFDILTEIFVLKSICRPRSDRGENTEHHGDSSHFRIWYSSPYHENSA